MKNEKDQNELALGDEARDKITGCTGVVIAITDWLNGCRRLTIQPKTLDKDGKPVECQTFDVQQMERVGTKTHVVPYQKVRPGGPRPSPSRTRDPR